MESNLRRREGRRRGRRGGRRERRGRGSRISGRVPLTRLSQWQATDASHGTQNIAPSNPMPAHHWHRIMSRHVSRVT
eukprot:2729714-Rhodomonas_salina.3